MSGLKVLIALCLVFTVASATTVKFSFDGYKLVRLMPTTEDHLRLLTQLEESDDFQVWNRVRGVNHGVEVALSPAAFDKYQTVFDAVQMSLEIVHPNIQEIIDEEQASMRNNLKAGSSIVGKYARYNDIINYINERTVQDSDLASSYSIGSTFEKRDLRVLVLKTSTSKRNIWLDCGIHAREWVSPSSCIWFIDRLIKDYRNQDPVAVDLLSHFEFHILPLYNPDGYEFTHTSYRLWRKNRNQAEFDSSCVGVDLNRNYKFQWMVAGSSLYPCADTYAGPFGDSELENQNVQKNILKYSGKWDAFITVHSYSAMWMIPYGYTQNRPADYDSLIEASKVGAAALQKVYGTKFAIGSPASLLYEASGGSFDWSYAVAGIKYSIALELRPSATGVDSQYGFMLPENRAPLAGEETYAGLKAFIDHVKSKTTQ